MCAPRTMNTALGLPSPPADRSRPDGRERPPDPVALLPAPDEGSSFGSRALPAPTEQPSRAAATCHDSSQTYARQLRIAVAMRGGVSLAVWMGGACRELVRLRQGSLEIPDEFVDGAAGAKVYKALLEECGYSEPVEIDVIAGTSAGGLNGVLLGWHLARGAGFGDDVRDMWLRLGDLGDLARRPLWNGHESLLRGDDYFFPQVRKALEQLDGDGVPCAQANHPLRLLVTATRLRPRNDAVFPGAGPRLGATESRSFFRFRYQGRSRELQGFDDFGDAEQMAYVARTTSSFPGAFEPATVNPYPKKSLTRETGAPNVHGISSETRTCATNPEESNLELIDGGVLDNVPLTWAVRAVAGMPADQAVNRWLLYLQPDPGNHAEDPPQTRSATRMLRSLFQTSQLKNNSESILDDEENLRQLVAAERRELAVLLGIDPNLDAPERRAPSIEQIDAYRAAVGCAEVRRLQRLASAPLTLVGLDPLPIPDTEQPLLAAFAAYDQSKGGPLAPVDDADAMKLVLPDERVSESNVGRCARTPLVAARAVTLLLHALRQTESARMQFEVARQNPYPRDTERFDELDKQFREQDKQFRDQMSELRKEIYTLRFTCEVTVAHRDRVLLDTITREPWRKPDSLLRKASNKPDFEYPEAFPDGGTKRSHWRTWTRHAAAAAAGVPPAPRTPPDAVTWKADPYGALWDGIVAQTVSVADLVNRFLPPGSVRIDPLLTVLRRATDTATADRALCRLEIATGPSRPDPLGASVAPKLVVASAAEQSPLEERIYGEKLKETERISRKLNGNRIGNFAAFLSARWRQNDWLWGRMDSAQSLVRLVATPDRTANIDAEKLRTLFFAGAPERGPFRDLLEREWVNGMYADNPPEKVVDAITTRLHWDILEHELEHLRTLHERKSGKDRPPSSTGREMRTPARTVAEDPQPALKLLADVGEESVSDLLRRPDLRRTQLQLALVGLGALFPAGWKSKLGYTATSVTAGPLAILPVLLAILAPWGMLVSMLALGMLTAMMTGRAMSLAQLPALLGMMLVLVCATRRFWKWRHSRFAVGVLGIVAIGSLLWVGRDWQIPSSSWPWPAGAAAAVVTVAAPMVASQFTAWHYAWRAHERGVRWMLPVGAVLASAGVSAVVIWGFTNLYGTEAAGIDPIGAYPAWKILVLVWILLAMAFWALLVALSVRRAEPSPETA
ncbi:patatin-like protein [Rhodococcus sp. O3]|uniref:patatin-like protein n=1 Tax=Rhodococcus sp. O3 TaxID=3404919 RepID=UPI003B679000